MEWNFNMDEAPRGELKVITRRIGKNEVAFQQYVGEQIIAAGSEGVVTLSRWLADEGRWNMFTKDVPPIAWQPRPAHPGNPK